MCTGFQAKTVTPVITYADSERATVKREDGLQVEPPGALELQLPEGVYSGNGVRDILFPGVPVTILQ